MKCYEFFAEGPHRFTRKTYFRDKDGLSIVLEDMSNIDSVSSCCAAGAIAYCYYNGDIHTAEKSDEHLKLQQAIGKRNYVTDWNDEASYEEVLAKFKELDL